MLPPATYVSLLVPIVGNYRATPSDNLKARPGSQITMSLDRLKTEICPPGTCVTVTIARRDGEHIGHALACRWRYGQRWVKWITQLVVREGHRNHGIAKHLLKCHASREDADIYGIASSSPYACMAAASVFGGPYGPSFHCSILLLVSLPADAMPQLADGITSLPASFPFVRENAAGILRECPIRYLRDARLAGVLFHPEVALGAVDQARTSVCALDTKYFVSHAHLVPFLAENAGKWPLGFLHHGREYMVIVEWKAEEKDDSLACNIGT